MTQWILARRTSAAGIRARLTRMCTVPLDLEVRPIDSLLINAAGEISGLRVQPVINPDDFSHCQSQCASRQSESWHQLRQWCPLSPRIEVGLVRQSELLYSSKTRATSSKLVNDVDVPQQLKSGAGGPDALATSVTT